MQPTILLLTLTTLAAAIPANTPRRPDNQMPAPPDISITDNHSPRARDNHSPAPPADENDNHSPRTHARAEAEAEAEAETEAEAAAAAAANRYHKWNAHGGCQTDWGGRCLNKCKAEAKDKGYHCKKVSDHIWKEECWLGWSVCTCYCSY